MAIDKGIPAWHLSANMYCAQQDVHVPWIAEISPFQYAGLSKRGKAQYDAKRDAEWQASADCKDEWRRKVYAAYKAGVFDWRKPPPEAHPEAVSMCIHMMLAEEKTNKAAAWQAFRRANDIKAASEVMMGDRLYDLMYNGYVQVVKVNDKSLRVKLERDGDKAKPYTADARRFYRLSYGDAQAVFEEAYKAGQAA